MLLLFFYDLLFFYNNVNLSYLLSDLRESIKLRSKVDNNCASDWADFFKTPVLSGGHRF